MVRFLAVSLLFTLSLYADMLDQKIRSYISEHRYAKNRAFIDIIFEERESYYIEDGRVDSVKVIETLKQNGLLKLFFDKPDTLTLTFKTSENPLFFVTLMGDTLRSIGYYRFMTNYAKKDNEGFVWRIALKAEYATDPIVLRDELRKRGCDIVDIEKENEKSWVYRIDMSGAHLNVETIMPDQELRLRRSLEPHWMIVESVKKLTVTSLGTNRWHPYIVFFDEKLRLVKVYKRDAKTWQVAIKTPQNAYYVKIADLYSLKNIKDGLKIEASGVK